MDHRVKRVNICYRRPTKQRAPLIFGRASITFGIGLHSSYIV